MRTVTVRHNFETGHRLPHLEGKCQSLHGHSWWAEVQVGSPDPLPDSGIIVEYGDLKRELRGWIDSELDHGLMLGHADPLVDLLADHGKVYTFGNASTPGEKYAAHLDWPTVEAVADLLAGVTDAILDGLHNLDRAPAGVVCQRVTVRETHVNAATWTRTPYQP